MNGGSARPTARAPGLPLPSDRAWAMKQFFARLDRDGERWLLLVLYSFIVYVIFIEVVRRFVLLYSSVWGEETARYAFIYLVWIGAAARPCATGRTSASTC